MVVINRIVLEPHLRLKHPLVRHTTTTTTCSRSTPPSHCPIFHPIIIPQSCRTTRICEPSTPPSAVFTILSFLSFLVAPILSFPLSARVCFREICERDLSRCAGNRRQAARWCKGAWCLRRRGHRLRIWRLQGGLLRLAMVCVV